MPIVRDTYKMATINFINSGALDIISIAYYIHGPELMKLISAILYVSRTQRDLRAVIKRQFLHLYEYMTRGSHMSNFTLLCTLCVRLRNTC